MKRIYHVGAIAAVGSTALWVVAAGCTDQSVQSPPPETSRELPAATPARAAKPGEVPLHMTYLGETVTRVNRKTAHGAEKYVIRADGRTQSFGEVMKEDAAKKREMYGALAPNLAQWVDSGEAHDRYVQIFFRANDIPEALRDGVNSDDQAEHDKAVAAVGDSLRAQGAGVAAELERLGARDVRGPELVATFFATLTPEAMKALARYPDVTGIYPNEHGTMHTNFTVPNTVSTPEIDTSFNAAGLYGGTYSMGFTEGGCEMWDAHESLHFATYDHSNSVTCTTDSDCGTCCYNCVAGTDAHCRLMADSTHRCVEDHVSEVASVVSAAHTVSGTLTKYGSAKANLRLYNTPSSHGLNVACYADSMQNAFNWFSTTAHKAHNIVEAWDCRNEGDGYVLYGSTPGPDSGAHPVDSGDGFTEDEFARQYGWLTVKAAGNISIFDDAHNYVYGCNASNALCAGGFDTTDGKLSPYTDSCWANNPEPFGTGSDREDPDIMALAVNTDTMNPASSSTTAWLTTNTGTSSSAPAIASMALLTKQACSADLNEKWLRALMMTSSWYFNPDGGTPYTTPATGYDGTDGAGGPRASDLYGWCGGTVSDGITLHGGSSTISVNGTDGNAFPARWGDPGMGPPPPGGGYTNWLYYPILPSVTLAAGSDVRATLTWDTCTDGTYQPTLVGSDLDLFLIQDPSDPVLEISSRSFDNNWEGFEADDLPAGTYQLWVGYDTTMNGCSGSGATEAISVAWATASSGFPHYPD